MCVFFKYFGFFYHPSYFFKRVSSLGLFPSLILCRVRGQQRILLYVQTTEGLSTAFPLVKLSVSFISYEILSMLHLSSLFLQQGKIFFYESSEFWIELLTTTPEDDNNSLVKISYTALADNNSILLEVVSLF